MGFTFVLETVPSCPMVVPKIYSQKKHPDTSHRDTESSVTNVRSSENSTQRYILNIS